MIATTPASPVRDVFGTIPGSFLDLASATASPPSFIGARWRDTMAVAGDSAALLTHLRVERWTCDEFALPGSLFERRGGAALSRGPIHRGNADHRRPQGDAARARHADPQYVPAEEPHSPPSTILPLQAAARNPRNRLIRYDGEHGVALQHVGILVGRYAHHRVWPEILDWIDACDA